MRRWRRVLLAASAVALCLAVSASPAKAQLAGYGRVYYGPTYTYAMPYYGGYYYNPVPTYGSSASYRYTVPGYTYANPSYNGYNSGSVGPGPVRDWTTGRPLPLAKPWLRPLQP